MSVINTSNAPMSVNSQTTDINRSNSEYSIRENQKTEQDKLTVVDENKHLDSAGTQKEADKEPMSSLQLEKVAQQLQDFVGEMNRSLEFLVDKDSGRDVIKVLDRGTGELVKQYPSEEVLTLISRLSDTIAMGNLVDTEI